MLNNSLNETEVSKTDLSKQCPPFEFLDSANHFQLWAVSDLLLPVQKAHIRLSMFALHSATGFEPMFFDDFPILDILPNSSRQIRLPYPLLRQINRITVVGGEVEEYLITALLVDRYGALISPLAVLYPDKMLRVGHYGTVRLLQVTRSSNVTYSVVISADSVLPLVWLDLSDQFKKYIITSVKLLKLIGDPNGPRLN